MEVASTENDQFQVPDHHFAIHWLFEQLEKGTDGNEEHVSLSSVDAVGHRVVHGGEKFSQPLVINDTVADEIDTLSELAPLHNPACLEGIRGARDVLGLNVPMVAVFDTAFHQIPADQSQNLCNPPRPGRRGIVSVDTVSMESPMPHCWLGIRNIHREALSRSTRLISFQLGNGCSGHSYCQWEID